jgi:hypothetical protein
MNLPMHPSFESLGSLQIMISTRPCEQQAVGRSLLMHAHHMIRRLLQDFRLLSLAEGAAQA